MRFSNSFLDEIRDRVNISDVIGRRVSWDKKKTNAPRGIIGPAARSMARKARAFTAKTARGAIIVLVAAFLAIISAF